MSGRAEGEFPKQAPLLVPVDVPDNRPQVALSETRRRRQEQDLFLEVRSQMEQLHDLRHARPRHPPALRHRSVIR